MSRILWLADALRAAGCKVVEHAGWQTHGWDDWEPQCGIVHATAAPAWQPDATQVAIVRDGRSDLEGPIANACLTRDGTWHVLASGRCNTTLAGYAGTPFAGYGNLRCLGIEACNDNLAEPWPAVQYEAYARGWAAICRRLGWTAANLVGHKEHTPGRKTDPTFNMATFRARVGAYLAGEGEDMTPEQAAQLAEVHSVITTGNRLGPSQTAGGGVPIAWEPRQFWEIDKAIAAVLDEMRAGQAAVLAKVATLAAEDGDESPTGVVTTEQIKSALRDVFADAGAAG